MMQCFPARSDFVISLASHLTKNMGKHKEWRKVAKKMRRKRIRTKLAKIRDALIKEEEKRERMSPTYFFREKAREEAEEAERLKHEEEARRWEEEERRVQEETALRKALLKELAEVKEKKRIEAEEEKKKKELAEKERQEKMAEYIYEFALGRRCSLPAEMLVPSESQPGKEMCPFFNKVAACRFWDACSRNHIRPALSDTLLFPGFYSHHSLSRIGQAEYDTDMSLEYDDKENYSHFLEFYRDIRYEFESCGRLTRIVVCCNPEPHLRGHVYVCYASEKEAMAAYLKFNGRFYGGKQLSCNFVSIPSWKSAICGLFFRKKCPKGNNCNFLHIFKDPGPPFYEPRNRHSPDDWRWSLSPESTDKTKVDNESGETKRRKNRKRSRSRERRSKSSERRARGRSRERRETERRRSRSRGRRKKARSKSREKNTGSKSRRSRSPQSTTSSKHRNRSKDRRSKSKEKK